MNHHNGVGAQKKRGKNTYTQDYTQYTGTNKKHNGGRQQPRQGIYNHVLLQHVGRIVVDRIVLLRTFLIYIYDRCCLITELTT